MQLFNGSYAMGEGVGNWDGHRMLKDQYDVHAPIFDQPCAALLTDLKRSGLLKAKDTAVLETPAALATSAMVTRDTQPGSRSHKSRLPRR